MSLNIKRFGTNYGGFYYPSNLDGLDNNSIIYCVGAGEDITHDIEIARKLGSDVYIFDPTPRAIEHVNYVKYIYDNNKQPINNIRFGGGDPNYWNILLNNKIDSKRIKFFNYGLFTEDKTVKFYQPSNCEFVSHSLVKGMKSENYITVNVKKLSTIMKELNHIKIDLLKIDIEGCECDVINMMLDEKICPRYLSVDFDLGWTGEKICDKKKCLDVIDRLITCNYSIIRNDRSDYSFKLN